VHFAIDESITLGDSLSTDACEVRIGRQALSPWQREELRIDVNKAISTLPCELAPIANLLRSVGIVEAAQELGIPRATLYRRIDSIRKAFELAGLNFYLGDQNTKSSVRLGSRTRPSRRRSADLAPRRALEGKL
jgi:RNA polymerase sigma-70 factor (ECF subfamily)